MKTIHPEIKDKIKENFSVISNVQCLTTDKSDPNWYCFTEVDINTVTEIPPSTPNSLYEGFRCIYSRKSDISNRHHLNTVMERANGWRGLLDSFHHQGLYSIEQLLNVPKIEENFNIDSEFESGEVNVEQLQYQSLLEKALKHIPGDILSMVEKFSKKILPSRDNPLSYTAYLRQAVYNPEENAHYNKFFAVRH